MLWAFIIGFEKEREREVLELNLLLNCLGLVDGDIEE